MAENVKKILSKMKSYHWMMMMYPFQFVVYAVLISNGLIFEKVPITALTDLLMISIPLLLLVGGIQYYRYSFSDYRFKSAMYMMIALLATVVALNNIYDEDVMKGGIQKLDALLVALIMVMIIVYGSIQGVNDLITPFKSQVESLGARIEKNDFSAQITDSNLLNDTVFGPVVDVINKTIASNGRLISRITANAQTLVDASEQLSANAEEVNASAEEVASTSQAMSDGATTQTELISEVNEKIDDLYVSMSDIIKKIQQNTQEVSSISLQTNILALNAGIEASRAGDYGRGFNVVADNVRKLSDQSKLASERIEVVAEEIQVLIKQSFSHIQNTMVNVVSVSEETAASAEEVAAAAEEMTSSMAEISKMAQKLAERAR
ncbi:MAG: hypothetical protein INQ03_22480 [Candidatus Heimdallarchaeota archaeon]|nr:hypothetical protein [Candidatus Heimdallarchaeota archaeon]